MIKTQPQQSSKPRSISSKQILIALVAVLLFSLLLSSVIGLMGKYLAMRKHIATLREEESTLEQKKATVSDMNAYIDTKEGQERVFRDKYRVIKEGEGMIVVANEEPIPTSNTVTKSGFGELWDSVLRGLGLR